MASIPARRGRCARPPVRTCPASCRQPARRSPPKPPDSSSITLRDRRWVRGRSSPMSLPSVAADDLAGIRFRRPTEADYPEIVRVIDDWWGGRKVDVLLPRLWLQHFTGTSWLAEAADGRLAGFLVGFLSPDQAGVAYCQMVATS